MNKNLIERLKALDGSGGSHYDHRGDGFWKAKLVPVRGRIGAVVARACSRCGIHHVHAGVER